MLRDIHQAAIRSASLCRYLSEAHALEKYEHPNDWRLNAAVEELEAVSKALGFDLVPRSAKKEAA